MKHKLRILCLLLALSLLLGTGAALLAGRRVLGCIGQCRGGQGTLRRRCKRTVRFQIAADRLFQRNENFCFISRKLPAAAFKIGALYRFVLEQTVFMHQTVHDALYSRKAIRLPFRNRPFTSPFFIVHGHSPFGLTVR